MLETRPLVQVTLIGFAAFFIVLSASMIGSAFMITGGFGFPSSHERQPTAVHVPWGDGAREEPQAFNYLSVVTRPGEEPLYEVRQTAYTPDDTESLSYDEAYLTPDVLDGGLNGDAYGYAAPSEDELRALIDEAWEQSAPEEYAETEWREDDAYAANAVALPAKPVSLY